MRWLRRLAGRWSRRDTIILLAGLVIVAGAGLPLPGYTVGPGRTADAAELISVTEVEAFEPRGSILVSTIALRPLSPFLALRAWLDDDIRTVPKARVEEPRSRARATEESKDVAMAVALSRLGFEVGHSGGGARVESVEPGSAAAGRLEPGDVITAVDGEAVSTSQEALSAIRGRRAGELLRLAVESPGGRSRTEQIELGGRGGTTEPVLGVALRTSPGTFQFPVEVAVDQGAIEGESAGLAFTLALLDVLTPGELTGGRRVAVTGTIEIDGRVGKVGSVTEKAIAARRAGASHFLVPSGQLQEAARGAGAELTPIEVSTVDEALEALERIGGEVTAARTGGRAGH